MGNSLSLKASEQFYDVTELDTNDIPDGYCNYHVITNRNITLLEENVAVRIEHGWMTAAEYARLKLSKGETRIATPFGSKAFSIESLTDSTKTPYEDMKAQVVVFQNGRPKYEFEFKGFKDFDADWIDEKLLKIVSWPGTRVKVTELINVETGRVIYKSAEGLYDRLGPPPSSVKKEQ
jgi:hypothetical protein